MSDIPRIVVRREETLTNNITAAVERSRALRRYEAAQADPVSPTRRLLYNPLFYLPLAGFVATFLVWSSLESTLNDTPVVGGEVILINDAPFDVPGTAITVGTTEVVVRKGETALVPGDDDQPAYSSLDDVRPGEYVEAAGFVGEPKQLIATALRPSSRVRAQEIGDEQLDRGSSTIGFFLLFPLTASSVALFMSLAEGISTRNWVRMVKRTFLSSLLAFGLSLLAFVPSGLLMTIADKALESEVGDKLFISVADLSTSTFLIHVISRSGAWACIGAAVGLGMNILDSTNVQRRNAVFGGALGGAVGGVFFDPIDRMLNTDPFADASLSRVVGLVAVGVCVGIFVALVERLAREAWFRVRTGPLAGKSFVLFRAPTTIGSSPEADIYLFKDPDIDVRHAAIHRVGTAFEVEDLSRDAGVRVNGERVRRRRLTSGDRVTIGKTVLEFEVRARRVKAEGAA